MFAECFCVYLLEEPCSSCHKDLAVTVGLSWPSTLMSGLIAVMSHCHFSSVYTTQYHIGLYGAMSTHAHTPVDGTSMNEECEAVKTTL